MSLSFSLCFAENVVSSLCINGERMRFHDPYMIMITLGL